MKAFFKRFPERKKNKLYLASESYGGHYIPQVLYLSLLLHSSDPYLLAPFLALADPCLPACLPACLGLRVRDPYSS
jgi:carboxypeptidase C (cathepsin A)